MGSSAVLLSFVLLSVVRLFVGSSVLLWTGQWLLISSTDKSNFNAPDGSFQGKVSPIGFLSYVGIKITLLPTKGCFSDHLGSGIVSRSARFASPADILHYPLHVRPDLTEFISPQEQCPRAAPEWRRHRWQRQHRVHHLCHHHHRHRHQHQSGPGGAAGVITTALPHPSSSYSAPGADLGPWRYPLPDRRRVQCRAQGPVQAGDETLGELDLHQVCGARARAAPRLDRLRRQRVRVSPVKFVPNFVISKLFSFNYFVSFRAEPPTGYRFQRRWFSHT